MMTWNIVWLVLMLVFLVAEGATAAMVSLWFVLGSLAALVTSLLGGEVWLQFVVFFLVSAVSLGLLRPLSKKFQRRMNRKKNLSQSRSKTFRMSMMLLLHS